MIVKCIKNQCDHPLLVLPSKLGVEIDSNNAIVSSEWFTIDTTISGYRITEGNDYTVYGMLFYTNQIRYLIADDNNMPGFFPSTLFSISKPHIWFDWEINEYTINSAKLIILGYAKITEKYEGLIDLIDRRKNAIRNFLDYKELAMKQHNP